MAEKKDDENITPVEPRETKAEPITPGDPIESTPGLSAMGATFAERRAAREKAEKKAVSSKSAENKSVSSSRAAKK